VIIVGGSFEVDPEQRDAFLASRHEVMRASRKEPGCIEYTFSADPIDPTRVLLFERWNSQVDLDAHLSALRSGPPPAGREVSPRKASIMLYDVASERSLGG
jgi:hypothetical protein